MARVISQKWQAKSDNLRVTSQEQPVKSEMSREVSQERHFKSDKCWPVKLVYQDLLPDTKSLVLGITC